MYTVKKADSFAVALVTCCLSAVVSPAHADDWEWSFTPYLWASDVGVDVTIQDEPVLGTDIAFEDLFDNLDFAAPLHFEGSRGRSGIFLVRNLHEIARAIRKSVVFGVEKCGGRIHLQPL